MQGAPPMKLAGPFLRLTLAGLLAAALSRFAAAQSPEFELRRFGLTDGLFTNSTGAQTSFASSVENGFIAGHSLMSLTTTSGGGSGGSDSGGGIIIGGGGIIIGGGGPISTTVFGQAEWLGNIATGVTTRIGLTSSEFTRPDGIQDGSTIGFHSGIAAGQSNRYDGTSGMGHASWIANASTGVTTRIGLFSADYTDPSGFQESVVQYVRGGYGAGNSINYSANGWATWVANGATGATTRIGFYDAGYTAANGYQVSTVEGLDATGVIGHSQRFDGENSIGTAAWVANPLTGVTTRLGFTGAGYTQADGTQTSRVQYINGGYVMGWSGATDGVNSLGSTQWVAPVSTGVAAKLGLEGAQFTSSEGVQISYADLLQDGYVGGQTYLYGGAATPTGHAAWVADAATGQSRRVGFFDTAPYIRADGFQESFTSKLNGTYIAGVSYRYSGSTQIGGAAWVATNTTGETRRIGLFDATYTATNGAQASGISDLKGHWVAGVSTRYNGNTPIGPTTWLADAATGDTLPLGLTDADHTGLNDARSSSITALTATGFVAGSSQRYASGAGNYNGNTSWIYDANTGIFDPIIFSIRPTDGFASSSITQLFDSGLAFGQYELYDASGNDLGARAFFWTPEDGAVDLASAVPGDLSAAGWTALNAALLGDPALGAIVGYANVPDNASTQAVYAAVPAPEPGSAALLLLGAAGLGACRRRSRRN